MDVRLADPSEYAEVGELTVAAYRILGFELGDYVDVLADVAGRVSSAAILVAVDGERLLGAVTYVPGPDSTSAEFTDPDAAGIRFLAVTPEAQGRGVGRALLHACLDRARKDGRARVILHTTEYMKAAQRLYASEGLRRDASLDEVVERGLLLMAYVADLDSRGA